MENIPSSARRSSLKQEPTRDDDTTETKRSRSVRFSEDTDIRSMEKYVVAALEETGECSLWLVLMLILCGWPAIIVSLQNALFSARETLDFRCYIQNIESSEWNFQMKKNISMPTSRVTMPQCTMYIINYTELLQRSYDEAVTYVNDNQTKIPTAVCTSVIADHGYFSEGFSFVENANLLNLCTDYVKKYLCLGGLFSRGITDFPMGIAADMFGRKRMVQINTLICFAGLLLTMFATSIWALFLGRALTASGGYASWLILYVYLNEVCSKHYRTTFCQLIYLAWGIGFMMAPCLLYYIQYWWYLHGAATVLIIVNCFTIWYIPESPRWLIGRQKYKTAYGIITNLGYAPKEQMNIYNVESKTTITKQLRIFRCPFLGCDIIKSTFLFTTSLLIVYVSRRKIMVLKNMNIYNYYIVLSVISIIHPLTAIPLLEFIGRKITISFLCTLLSIVYCSLLIETLYGTDHLLLHFISINFSSVLNNIVFAYTAELYPVTFSATILGFVTTFSTLITIIHEIFVNEMELRIMQYLWYTSFCTVATIVIMFLPETSNKLLPLDEYQARFMFRH